MSRIATLITCHNRKDKTLSCLAALFQNILPEGYALDVYLVDDGSTDGTAHEVHEAFPQVNIIQGNGELYWNRGMHKAWQVAAQSHDYDYYLWLNDDTLLNANGYDLLFSTIDTSGHSEVIVVGSLCDPVTGRFTYGGSRHVGGPLRPFLCEYVIPNGQAQALDVFNGNVVLIPDVVARKVGNLDPVFQHAMGDTDYSMRARKLGVSLLITGDYVGSCSINNTTNTHLDWSLPFYLRLKLLFSRKGLPIRSWFVMCRRHGGWLWPIHFAWGYVKIIAG